VAPNARDERIDTNDPQRHLVYAAEDSVLDDIGRRLRRWTDVEAFVEAILADPAYLDLFPDAPLDVVLDRRSRSARASVALPDRATILIRDGSWNALTVLHELSHLVSPDREPHGVDFVATELALVRRFCGFDAFATLASTFVAHGVAAASVPLASARGAD
jgi:putative metallohydrolase (TIGR04338 family)